MDLRSIINDPAGDASARAQTTPVTPVQSGPPQPNFRDYSHPPHASPFSRHPSQDYGPGSGPGPSPVSGHALYASPNRHPSQDYGPAPSPKSAPYSVPTSYQGQAPFTRPPPPPPIQAPPQSPAGSYSSHSAPSPYRQTPTSGMSNNQYPFPPNHQTPPSPAQNHQYPQAQINGSPQLPSKKRPSPTTPSQPPPKRMRYSEPPIWAQSVRRKSVVPTPAARPSDPRQQPVPLPARPSKVLVETNGHTSASKDDPSKLLGPWEPSIVNKKPQEQITKEVADWLYLNVVNRKDFRELDANGIEVEIEAKLGQLIDSDTNHRLELPVRTETVLSWNDRRKFRSSMTEAQHRMLNDFLNVKVQETHPSNPEAQTQGRVPIEYRHRRETDKFYELPLSYHSSLPPVLRAKLNPRHAIKVRVSHDQKTGEVIAKIIKQRLENFDIYNPQYPLDCRISINLEMRWDGDLEELRAAAAQEHKEPDRNKDRLSYTQSHYQIDLTQVTQLVSLNGVNRTEKEHELEVELSAAAVRDQGQRLAGGQENEYCYLVEGFLDNVRVLARAVPPA